MRRITAGPGEMDIAAAPVTAARDPRAALRDHWGVPAAAALGALLPQTWFRAGTFIAAGDVGPALRGLTGVTALWTTETTGTGSTGVPSAMLLERGLLSMVRGLGGSPELAQRLWFTVVLAVTAAAVAWLAGAFVRRPAAVFAAGVVAVLNPFVLTTVPDLLPLIAVACTAGLLGMVVRVSAGRHVPVLVPVAVAAWSAELARNPPLLVLVALVGAVAVAVLAINGPRWVTARLVGALLAGASFWVVPLLIHRWTGTPGVHPVVDPDPDAFDWAQRHGGPANVLSLVSSWQWGEAELLPATVRLSRFPWSLMRWALPAAVALSAVFTWRRRITRVVLLTIAVSTVLAVGMNPPFGPVYDFLVELVPGYDTIRQPMTKFGVLLVVCFAVAIAVGVDDGLTRWQARAAAPEDAQSVPALLVLLGIAVVFVHPLLTGTVIPGERAYLPSARVALPDSLVDAGAALDDLAGYGATLVLPLSDSYRRGTVWGYYGIDDVVSRLTERPTYELLPDGQFEPDGASPDLMVAAESALVSGDEGTLTGAMRAMGARYLAVRTDTTTEWGRNREFRDGGFLVASAQRLGLREVGTFEYVTVFEVPPADRFAVAARTIALASDGRTDPDEATAVAVSLLDGSTAIGLDGDVGTAWVPDPGDAGLALQVAPGEYVTRSVSRGPSMWRATARGRAVELVPLDRADVDGESLLDLRPIVLRANRTPYALLVGNDPEQGVERMLVPLDGATQVQLVSGAPVSLLTVAPSIVGLRGNEARLCKRADGPPVDDAPPPSGATADTTATSVTFTVGQGTVCISDEVRLPRPVEGHRRWRLTAQYRTTDPGAPRTCLWSSVKDQCLPGSRLTPDAASGRIDTLIDAEGDLGDVQLVLAADHVGRTDDPPIEVAFTDVRLSPIQESDDPVIVTAPIGTPPVTTVDDGGAPLVIGVGNGIGDLLGAFGSEVGECALRDDDLDVDIDVTPLPQEPAPAFELTAARSSACVQAPIDAQPGLRDVVTSFEYRAPRAGTARVAVIDASTGEVVLSRRLPASTFWAPVEIRWQLPPAPVGSDEALRLVVTADGPAVDASAQPAVVAYRGIEMLPTPPYAFAVLPALPDDVSEVTVRTLGDRYVAVQGDGDVVLTFHQAYATDWSIDGLPDGVTADHVMVNGWANGWVIGGLDGRAAVLSLHYRWEWLVAVAVWSVLAVWLVTLACTDWRRLFARRPDH
jgi:arabinofuranan 3-O-arabinosyltransferase